MNISGVLVRAYPQHIQNVWKQLTQIEGVEVHGSNDDGRMVVTVEQDDGGEVLTQAFAGQLSTSSC